MELTKEERFPQMEQIVHENTGCSKEVAKSIVIELFTFFQDHFGPEEKCCEQELIDIAEAYKEADET